MKKLMKKRTGFTLVELLIVIIIIGILAGAMLLVAGSGTDKAEATKIVSNLRSMKAAALMYWADNPNDTSLTGGVNLLKKYMDRPFEGNNGTYQFITGSVSGDDDGGWFVGLKNIAPAGAREKLVDVASSTALLKAAEIAGDTIASTDLYTGGNDAYMRAR